MARTSYQPPDTLLTDWARNDRPSREERDKCDGKITLSLCIFVATLLYIGLYSVFWNDLWYSYDESLCFIMNATAITKGTFRRSDRSYLQWIVNVTRQGSNSDHYLADIEEEFDYYYKAHEAALSTLTGVEQRCYTHQKEKFDVRWKKSSNQAITSACFGIFTLFFLLIWSSCVQSILYD